MTVTRPRRGDGGSAAAQATVALPLVLIVLLLVVAGGRLTSTAMDVSYAAHAAARAASLARSSVMARRAASDTAASALASRSVSCAARSTTVDTGRFAPGGIVTVTVSCTVYLADVAVLALPGSTTITRTSTSPIDTWRGVTLSDTAEGKPR